jgi:hypothetical protein
MCSLLLAPVWNKLLQSRRIAADVTYCSVYGPPLEGTLETFVSICVNEMRIGDYDRRWLATFDYCVTGYMSLCLGRNLWKISAFGMGHSLLYINFSLPLSIMCIQGAERPEHNAGHFSHTEVKNS